MALPGFLSYLIFGRECTASASVVVSNAIFASLCRDVAGPAYGVD